MRHLDLFSGIGGFALAARWAGIETVGFCEVDKFCTQVLNKNFPGIKVEGDIRGLRGTDYDVDIISGGYPCQPFSVAGAQRAHEDHRHLWPEMYRVIREAQPEWVVAENVYGHIKLGLDEVLTDLADIGYTTETLCIPSAATGGNHRRDRVYIVAHSASNGRNEGTPSTSNGEAHAWSKEGQEKDWDDEGRSSVRTVVQSPSTPTGSRGTEPPALRVDDGLPHRMDRNRAIGNSIDPYIAYNIFRSIK